MVGDADQSIYAFRGATIRNIVEFEQDYPDATVILLEQNYRSTQNILAAANAVVSQNQGRKPKNLWSDQGAGPPIVGYVADNEHDEAAFVAEEVDRLTDAGQATARPGGRLLPDQRAVPGLRGSLHPGRAAVPGGRRGPVLRAARGPGPARLPAADRQPGDEVSLRRVLNVPKRGIGDRAEEYVAAFAQRERITLRAGAGPAGRGARAGGPVGRARSPGSTRSSAGCASWPRTAPVAELAEAVLDRTGYLESLESSSDLQDVSRVENLEELVSVAREFDGGRARTARWPSSSSRCRWSPTPTRSRRARSTAAW